MADPRLLPAAQSTYAEDNFKYKTCSTKGRLLLRQCSPKRDAWQEAGQATCRPVARQALTQAAEPVVSPAATISITSKRQGKPSGAANQLGFLQLQQF
jgi:hypothetical protein